MTFYLLVAFSSRFYLTTTCLAQLHLLVADGPDTISHNLESHIPGRDIHLMLKSNLLSFPARI